MAGHDSAVLDAIRTGIDIVEVVGEFVVLRKAGANWKGLCPFHVEKTPSFTVTPAKRIFHCFGCGAGGDVFSFLMRQDRLSFPEAVRVLAHRAGVPLPTERAAGDTGRRETLLHAMDLAAGFYTESLWAAAGERARHYLGGRGITEDVARRFRLGYAPEGWTAVSAYLKSRGLTEDVLIEAGLAIAREGGGSYDRFRHRLLFPIKDLQGRVVALGGRALGDEQPKYLNSPETPLYAKGEMLYAMDLARDTIRTRDRALLVEGYVDVVMAHQHGFTETVAALGTAFTAAQLALLRRHTSEVVTFFDADAAGQKAAQRAEELLEPSRDGAAWAVNRTGSFGDATSLRIKVALLPPGHDPDTFLRAEGPDAFARQIAEARSLLSYAVDRALAETPDVAGPRGRATAFARVALILSKVQDSEEAASLSRDAARKLGVDATQLWIEAQRRQTAVRRPVSASPAPAAPARAPLVERDLVALLLQVPASRGALLPRMDEDDLTHPALRAIVAALRPRPEATAESLMPDLPGDAERGALAALLVEERDWSALPEVIAQFQARFEMKQRRRRMHLVTRGIAEAQAAGAQERPELEADLRALQREGEEARELLLGARAGREPAGHQVAKESGTDG
jgi:DNA primase